MHLIQPHGIDPIIPLIVPLTPKRRSFPKSHALTDWLIRTLPEMLVSSSSYSFIVVLFIITLSLLCRHILGLRKWSWEIISKRLRCPWATYIFSLVLRKNRNFCKKKNILTQVQHIYYYWKMSCFTAFWAFELKTLKAFWIIPFLSSGLVSGKEVKY